MANIGESGEVLFKIKLVMMRDAGESFNGEKIQSVGFDNEYRSFPSRFSELQIIPNIDVIAGEMNIEKASVYEKADVFVNHEGVSLKSTYGANSALVNHTARPGFARVCEEVGADITVLDNIIDHYWELRLSGQIGEDVCNWDPKSPFREHKEFFRPILEYFLFVGSGSKASPHPAEYIIEYADPMNPKKWKKVTKTEAIDMMWDKLVFSLRSKKGMPTDYTLDYKGKNAESIARWVRECDGSYKGALHIRIKDN